MNSPRYSEPKNTKVKLQSQKHFMSYITNYMQDFGFAENFVMY